MDTTVLLFAITALLVVLFILGVPIFVGLAVWCILISQVVNLSLANIGIALYEGLNFFGLLAMPLFILTGDLINVSGIAVKLTRFAHSCFCWIRGGQAIAALGACGIFAAISGSNAATTATIGTIMYPEMVKDGYDRKFAAATIAAGGTVGIIIPPSILFITYGFLVNIPASDLFIGGIFPGILMVLVMQLVCFIFASKNRWGSLAPFNGKGAGKAAREAYLGFAAIFVIMFGIYTGAFSPTESAAMCVAFCLGAGIFITKEISLKTIPSVFFSSGKLVGTLAPLVAISSAVQQCISAMGVDIWLQENFLQMGYTGVLTVSMVIIFVSGMFLESVPIITILAPILAPIAHAAGIHPVHFAVIVLVGTTIGFITPPFGLNIFVACSVTDLPFRQVIRYLWPYVIGLSAVWILCAIFPIISTALVSSTMY